MKVDIWSDVVCPWCYLGKRRFEKALAAFPHRDGVEVRWRSFELDPGASSGGLAQDALRARGVSPEQLAAATAHLTALAAEEGLTYRLAEAHAVNSFDLHRLLHFASAQGVGDAVLDALMHAQHCAAADLSDRAVLLSVVDLPGAADLLAGTSYTSEVRADEAAARRLGINGVPAFVLADKYLVSGAQSVPVMTEALGRAWQEAA
jgi:predicted DsbA family dithiol-disulfide isomerase